MKVKHAKLPIMNARIQIGDPSPVTTQAAEGLPRRKWTVAEIDAMVRAGIIDEHEHFELIDGDAVPLAPRSLQHEIVRMELNEHLQRAITDAFRAAPTTTLRLDEYSFLEPDFCFFARTVTFEQLRGHHVELAIEIADTSLRYDLGRKIGIYAAFGIPEVWVINANTLVTHVHRSLGAEGFRTVFEAGPADEITSVHVPTLRMCLSELDMTPF
ncbi:Uma2 family endonuclease [Mesorhizobium sp. LHD-90]|uniref:Uma2 family endonuclease n=1 Tax=Mesorhizobium sp. LHD-90 TaxID=3071414 RepID=UPI0027DF3D23|nr:Uma2 family endonuclease [Mesorhizobium sp. LHD-90]MDQ6436456.1 Uma2 family endonuclease [Mesorhizobium sp. LHD-90]